MASRAASCYDPGLPARGNAWVFVSAPARPKPGTRGSTSSRMQSGAPRTNGPVFASLSMAVPMLRLRSMPEQSDSRRDAEQMATEPAVAALMEDEGDDPEVSGPNVGDYELGSEPAPLHVLHGGEVNDWP